MKYAYDLHIHSALSPCADDDMTPNNIVGMAAIKGLDIIAVTDHNSCGNVRATLACAKQYNITVIPGIEVETDEEVHVICYFPTIEATEKMHEIVTSKRMQIKNNPKTFGNQFYMDENDKITGIEENLLVCATMLSFQEVFKQTERLGGIAVPAHIDRSSCSVISNLGFIPSDTDVRVVEITAKNLELWKGDYQRFGIITNSDAHTLGDIAERGNFLCTSNKKDAILFDFFMQYFML